MDRFFRTKTEAKDEASRLRAAGWKVRMRKARADRKGEWIVYTEGRRNPSKRKKSASKRVSAALKKYMASLKKNPGRKVKGGRSVSLKNFTGSVIRKSNGQVVIKGKGKRTA